MGILSGFIHRAEDGTETPLAVENVVESPKLPDLHPDVKAALDQAAKLGEELAAERKARQADAAAYQAKEEAAAAAARTAKADGIRSAAGAFALAQVKAGRLMPHGRPHAEALHAFVHLSDAGLPTEGLDPSAALDGVFAAAPPHSLTREKLPAHGAALPAGVVEMDPDGDIGPRGEKMSAARIEELLAHTPTGQAAIAAGLHKP